MNFWERRSASVNVIGALLMVGVSAVVMVVVLSIASWLGMEESSIWQAPLMYGAILFGSIATVVGYDRRPLEWLGVGFHQWTVREILLGLAAGVGLATVAWLPIGLIGSVDVNSSFRLLPLAEWALIIVALSCGEEILFRGYLFQRACEVFGVGAAAILFSLMFAALHIPNPGSTVLTTANTFLAGLFFSGAFLATRSLWFVAAVHTAWNLLHSVIVGVPMSGFDSSVSLLSTSADGPGWLVGGEYGPEGAVWTTIALSVGFLVLARSSRIRQAPWSFARIFESHVRRPTRQSSDIL